MRRSGGLVAVDVTAAAEARRAFPVWLQAEVHMKVAGFLDREHFVQR